MTNSDDAKKRPLGETKSGPVAFWVLLLTNSQLKSVESLVGVILVTKVDSVDLSRGFNFVVRLSVTLMKKSLK